MIGGEYEKVDFIYLNEYFIAFLVPYFTSSVESTQAEEEAREANANSGAALLLILVAVAIQQHRKTMRQINL
jgi:hypothetical protein